MFYYLIYLELPSWTLTDTEKVSQNDFLRSLFAVHNMLTPDLASFTSDFRYIQLTTGTTKLHVRTRVRFNNSDRME